MAHREESSSRAVFINKIINFSYGCLKISVASTCCWTIQVNDDTVNLYNHTLHRFQEQHLTSCSLVCQLIDSFEESSLCTGNPDSKFNDVKERKKGVFQDRFGIFYCCMIFCVFFNHSLFLGKTVAFHDSRQLPSETIRTTSCCLFVAKGCERCLSCDEYRYAIMLFLYNYLSINFITDHFPLCAGQHCINMFGCMYNL